MARLTQHHSIGSWPVAVVLATGAAACTMVATAAVSVLTDDRVAAAGELYGPPTPSFQTGPREGRRAVRMCDLSRLPEPTPFPDSCIVRYVPLEMPPVEFEGLTLDARPLHEAVEVPENFI